MQGPEQEKAVVRGAVTTDFILSSEIMVISLGQVADAPLIPRALTLIIVAFVITALVYGVVALIVKMDDIGLHLSERKNNGSQRFGRGLVKAMPMVLNVLSTVGIAAMLWVGGHILLSGADTLGWHAPYALLHLLEAPAEHIHPLLGWIVDALVSAVAGLVVGAVLVLIMHLLPFRRKAHAAAH